MVNFWLKKAQIRPSVRVRSKQTGCRLRRRVSSLLLSSSSCCCCFWLLRFLVFFWVNNISGCTAASWDEGPFTFTQNPFTDNRRPMHQHRKQEKHCWLSLPREHSRHGWPDPDQGEADPFSPRTNSHSVNFIDKNSLNTTPARVGYYFRLPIRTFSF